MDRIAWRILEHKHWKQIKHLEKRESIYHEAKLRWYKNKNTRFSFVSEN